MAIRDELTRLLVDADYAVADQQRRASAADAFSADIDGLGRATFVLRYADDCVLGAVTLTLDETCDPGVASQALANLAETRPQAVTTYAFTKVGSLAMVWTTDADGAAVDAARTAVDLVRKLRGVVGAGTTSVGWEDSQ